MYLKIEEGQQFNRLTLTGVTEKRPVSKTSSTHNTYAEAVCECGDVRFYRFSLIKKGRIKSCGCLNREMKNKTDSSASNKECI